MEGKRKYGLLITVSAVVLWVIMSCTQNPFIGVGNAVDLEAPLLMITSHKNLDFVGSTFTLSGTATDNVGVTGVVIKEPSLKKEWKAVLSGKEWKAVITLPDGEYEFHVFAFDKAGNNSNKSYQVITLTVDSDMPKSQVTEPRLMSISKQPDENEYNAAERSALEFDKIDNYIFENIDLFQNKTFSVKGFVDENFRVKSVNLRLEDFDGNKVFDRVIENGKSPESGISGSVWNWEFKIDSLKDIKYENDIIDPEKRYYYLVRVITTDMAGNEEDVPHGIICVYQRSDIPWNIISLKDNDIVPAGGLISGNAYDDDDIKKVYLKIVPADTEVKFDDYKSFKDFSSDTVSELVIDKSKESLRIFTWMIKVPERAGRYKLYALVEDIDGAVNDKFDTVEFQVPDVDMPITIITSPSDGAVEFGNPEGNFTINGYSYDNTHVERLVIAWVPSAMTEKASGLNVKSVWSNNENSKEWSADGIKFWDLTGKLKDSIHDKNILPDLGGRWKRTFEKTFNVDSDFTEYADKLFVIYTEDTEGNFGTQRYSLAGDRVSPVLRITKPSKDGVYLRNAEGDRFEISGTVTDNTGKLKSVNVRWVEGNQLIPALITVGSWKVTSDMFELNGKGGTQNFEVTAEDFYGNRAVVTRFVMIDNDKPSIVNITSSNDSGYYKAGDIINVVVEFSKNVNITGTPYIPLNSSDSAKAVYQSGSGSPLIVFKYDINTGDNTAALDYKTSSPIELNEGSIKDAALNDYNPTFVEAGNDGSLSKNKSIKIDTISPVVQNVTSNTYSNETDNHFNEGKIISIQVKFNEPVIVEGSPRLKLNVGENKFAAYTFGSTTDTLTFNYTVNAGDNSDLLNYMDVNSFELNGGSVKDLSSNIGILTLPALNTEKSLGSRGIVIDTTPPAPLDIEGIDGGDKFTLKFDSNDIPAEIRYSLNNADPVSVTEFTGAQLVVDIDVDINVHSISARQRDKAGNWSDERTSMIRRDNEEARITGVTSNKVNGHYKTGEVINIRVTFNRNVKVTGSPRLKLNSGDSVYAEYDSGSESNQLIFKYTVASGENTTGVLDYISDTALELNSGMINDMRNGLIVQGEAANLALPNPGETNSLGANKNIVIDTTKPTVLSVSSIYPDGRYTVGTTIDIFLKLSESVIVTGTPELALNSGGEAVYSSGSGSDTLVFKYEILSGENTPSAKFLEYTGINSLTLNGGTIEDPAGNDAVLTLETPEADGSLSKTKKLVIDTKGSVITEITSTNTTDAFLNAGKTITVELTFDELVYVTGVPEIKINAGTDKAASYSTGSGTNKLAFLYTIADGDAAAPLNYDSVNALSKGTIKDGAGNDVVLTLPGTVDANGLRSKNLTVITVRPDTPGFTGVEQNKHYPTDREITFTGKVAGNTVRYSTDNGATWTAGDSFTTSTAANTTKIYNIIFKQTDPAGNESLVSSPLVFTIDKEKPSAPAVSGLFPGTYSSDQKFTIQAIETKIQYQLVTGGSWSDYTGEVTLTNQQTYQISAKQIDLAGNISNASSSIELTINKNPPTVTGVTSTTTDGYFTVERVVSIVVDFTENLRVEGTPRLRLGIVDSNGNAVERYAVFAYTAGTDPSHPSSPKISDRLVFSYTVQAGDNSADLDYHSTTALQLNGASIKDLIGNNATLTLPSPGAAGSLAANKAIVIDTKTPAAPTIVGLTAGIYNETKTFTITGEAGATIQYSINGGSTWTNYASAVSLSADNLYTVTARQTDQALNTSVNAANIVVTIDKTPPDVPVITGIVAGTYSTDRTFTIQGMESNIQYRLTNTGSWLTYSGAVIVSDEGTYQIAARQTDPAGNVSPISSIVEFTIDKTPPTVTSVSSTNANGHYNAGKSITVTALFTKAVYVTGSPRIQLKTNNGTKYASYSLGSGTNTLSFTYIVQSGDNSTDLDYTTANALTLNSGTIRDEIGNNATLTLPAPGAAGSLGANKNIVIDTTAPAAPTIGELTAGIYNTDRTFTISGEDGAAIEYSINGGSVWTPYSGIVTLSADNLYTVTARQTDLAGNTSVNASNIVVTVDKTPPETPAVAGIVAGTFSTNQTFTIQGAETHKEYSLSDGAVGTWVVANGATISAPDTYNLVVRQKDLAGNYSANSATLTFTIDKTAPVVQAVDGTTTDGYFNAGKVLTLSVIFSKSVYVSGVPRLQLETDNYATYALGSGTNTLSFSYTVQPGDNTNRLKYKATNSLDFNGGNILDAIGNQAVLTLPAIGTANSLDIRRNYRLDTNAPAAPIRSGDAITNGSSYNAEKNVIFTGETGATIIWSIDNNQNLQTNGTTSVSYTTDTGIKTQKTYTFIAKQRDLAGNESPYTTPITITINRVKPATPVISGITAGSYLATQNFAVLGSEANIQYSTNNGSTWSSTSSGTVVSLGGVGTYNIKARQTDLAGNVSDEAGPVNITILPTALLRATSDTPSGTYIPGQTIGVRLDFNEPVRVTTAGVLTLSNGKTFAIPTTGTTYSSNYDFSYVVGSASSEDTGVNSLNVTSITGTFKDDAGNTASITIPTGSNLANAKSISIDTIAPTITTYSPTHNQNNVNSGTAIVLTFSEPVFKESGNIEIVRRYNRFPLVMTINEYNEWKNRITGVNLDDYYYLGTIGANSSGVTDTVGKFILKYEYNSDNTILTDAFTSAGYNKRVIDVESTQVSISSNVVTITPNNPLDDGIDYYVTISDTAFRDKAGRKYAGISNDTTYSFVTGRVATPVIRINKQSGNGATQPTQTQVKISTQTNGATLYYGLGNNAGSVPGDVATTISNDTPFTIGSNDFAGNKIHIRARATRASLTDSYTTDEKAFKTVLIGNIANQTNNQTWFRGSNNTGGPTSVPGFPIAWEANLYDKVRLSNTSRQWVTWEINVRTYYKALSGYQGSYPDGPNGFRWQEGNNNVVDPGEAGTSAGGNWESGWYLKGTHY